MRLDHVQTHSSGSVRLGSGSEVSQGFSSPSPRHGDWGSYTCPVFRLGGDLSSSWDETVGRRGPASGTTIPSVQNSGVFCRPMLYWEKLDFTSEVGVQSFEVEKKLGIQEIVWKYNFYIYSEYVSSTLMERLCVKVVSSGKCAGARTPVHGHARPGTALGSRATGLPDVHTCPFRSVMVITVIKSTRDLGRRNDRVHRVPRVEGPSRIGRVRLRRWPTEIRS